MIRLVLAETVTRDHVDDAAAGAGFRLLNIVPATAEYPAQIIWAASDRRTLVHIVDDARLDTLHAVIQGAGEEEVAAALRARLPVRGAPMLGAPGPQAALRTEPAPPSP